ncbi:MAG TPA: M12 family metallo-peptidase [Luteitalea sp.]|nr:M12 family metallo-peptidase [Luteitalea sp.]
MRTMSWSARFAAIVLVVFAGSVIGSPAAAQSDTNPTLFSLDTAEARTDAAAGAPAAVLRRRARAVLAPSALATAERLRIPLPDGRTIEVARERLESLPDAGQYWRGGAADGAHTHVRLVGRGDVLVGTIESGSSTYLLGMDASRRPVLDEVPASGVVCGGGLVPVFPLATSPAASRPPTAGAIAEAAGGPQVDLLVVYTAAARVAAGGTTAMRATVDLAVAATNDALANSLVQAGVRLVDVREVPYVESRSLETDLDRLTELNDGVMDDVHTWRNASGADLVSLIVERNDLQLEGLAWLMQSPSVFFESRAFSVVMRRAAAALTLAHEVGHNLGLAHDRANALAAGAFDYAYGYRNPPYFRDLMSYPCSGAPCPAVPYFSNPDVTYGGRPMGVAGQADNARALRQTMPIAATFRAGPPPTLTSVTPPTAGTLGDSRVTLVGTRLSTVSRVLIDGVDVTELTILTPDSLSVVAPRHPAGVVIVAIVDEFGTQTALLNALTYVPTPADADGDALDDDWERAMGLDPASATGANGPSGDPDGDGVSNLRERTEHGHPNGQYRRFFAEGAQSAFFATQLALLNAGAQPTAAVVRILDGTGAARSLWRDLPPRTRRTITPADILALGFTEFSIVVESAAPIVVDRTMSWAQVPYGAHAETSLSAPALRWFLAEGATSNAFNLFYLLQNPNAQPAQVRIRYLRGSGAPLERIYTLAPTSRTNVWVNQETFGTSGRALASAEVSADIEVLNGQPIVVERAMYRDVVGQSFGAGHVSAGATTPGTDWLLAEGATGPWFDLFVLIANPASTAATAEVTYLLPDGSTIVSTHTVPATSRYTIWVDQEDARLANTAVSTAVRILNSVPVVVERAMWWPGTSDTWYESHNAVASRNAATRWALAEGEVGGTPARETYVLIANTGTAPGTVDVTLLFENGTTAVRTFPMLARSRFNVDVAAEFPEAAGRRFGVLVESVGAAPAPLVVERAMYWDAAGQRWAAGTNAVATPLP